MRPSLRKTEFAFVFVLGCDLSERAAEVEQDLSRASDTLAAKQSAEALSFVITIEAKNVNFEVTNRGKLPHQFFDCLELGWSGHPRHTWIQVLKSDGELYEEWPADHEEGLWSPYFLSNTLSDIGTRIPAELDTLQAGGSRTLTLPLEKFFEHTKFDRRVQGYRVRVVSHLYLDPELTHYFRSRSDWVKLEF